MEKDYKDLKIGREFELIEGKRLYLREWTRTVLVIVFVFACLAALAIAAYFGIRAGDSKTLLSTWAVVAAPLSAITGYYFGRSRPSGEDNDTSSI